MTFLRTAIRSWMCGFAYKAVEEQGIFETGEAKKGLTTFLEKRPSNFA